MALRKKMTTEEDKRFWSLAFSASKEVEAWPEWKRGSAKQNGSSANRQPSEKPDSSTGLK